jgi:hypothetical protein
MKVPVSKEAATRSSPVATVTVAVPRLFSGAAPFSKLVGIIAAQPGQSRQLERSDEPIWPQDSL